MSGSFTESVVEQAALAWSASVGWQVRNGAEIAPGERAAEREWFKPWRAVAGDTPADAYEPELQEA